MLKQDFGVEKISMINISASINLLATTASKIRLYFVYNTILTQLSRSWPNCNTRRTDLHLLKYKLRDSHSVVFLGIRSRFEISLQYKDRSKTLGYHFVSTSGVCTKLVELLKTSKVKPSLNVFPYSPAWRCS